MIDYRNNVGYCTYDIYIYSNVGAGAPARLGYSQSQSPPPAYMFIQRWAVVNSLIPTTMPTPTVQVGKTCTRYMHRLCLTLVHVHAPPLGKRPRKLRNIHTV